MKSSFTAFFYILVLTAFYLISGCSSSKTMTTKEQKDTTVQSKAIKETVPLFSLDNGLFFGAGVDSSGDTTFRITVAINKDTAEVTTDVGDAVAKAIGNGFQRTVSSIMFKGNREDKKLKVVGTATLDVKERDIPVSIEQTVSIKAEKSWQQIISENIRTVLYFICSLVVLLFILKQVVNNIFK